MKKILCKIFGHSFRYNFPFIPNKRICERCYKKEVLNLRTFKWDGKFVDYRTDEELVKKWFR